MPNPHLPTKICVQCGRPFAWRKKWERDWERVKYCSKRCAGEARPTAERAADEPRRVLPRGQKRGIGD